MQRKLMLYWVSMILVVFAAVILLLSIAGAFSQNDEQLHEVMQLHLQNRGVGTGRYFAAGGQR